MYDTKLSEYSFLMFKDLVYKESGIFFTDNNDTILKFRITSLMDSKSIDDSKELYKIISSDKKELRLFLDIVTTNLTKFFRTRKHFEILKKSILPTLIKKRNKNEKIRIWSAGCSTGEEPYSIAMACLENEDISPSDVEILATDISYKSLEVAKNAIYDIAKLENISNRCLNRYFDMIDSRTYKIKDHIRNMISFEYDNLIHEDNKYPYFDIIFCRNVFIYFDNQSIELTVNKFYDILKDNGYLFIGHSESLFGLDTKFIFHNIDDTIFYTKNNGVF